MKSFQENGFIVESCNIIMPEPKEIEKILGKFKEQTGFIVSDIDLRTENVESDEAALFAKVKNKDYHAFITFNPHRAEIINWGWVIPAGLPAIKAKDQIG